jgi:ribosomal protein S1
MNESKPGANAPPDDGAVASSSLTSETATTNTTETNLNPKGTMNMNTTDNTSLVAGTTVTGIVESKNQHGVNLTVGGAPAFLPVANLGETSIGDLVKGTEIAVTVVDTTGAKPRVTIAAVAQDATETAVTGENLTVASGTATEEGTAAVVESTEDAPAAGESTEGDDLQASIARLAATWGASVKIEVSGRKPSSKPVKAKKAPVPVANAVVAEPVVAPAQAVVVEPVAVVASEVTEAPVVETAPLSPKEAFFASIHEGDEVTASVKFKKDFGVHLVVGKFGFGLLHVSEMPGANMEAKKAFLAGLKYKQELKVRVIKVDAAASRLGFSMVSDEKAAFFASLKVGTVVEGVVVGSKEIGAFVNIGKTVGFLHVSEVEGKSREVRDAKLASFKRDDKLELVVIDINREKQEVRLSQKRLPLAALEVGSTVTGSFSSVRGTTIHVDLEVGGRGLLPKKGGKRYEYGEAITATVKSVNVARGEVELA